MTDLPTTAFDEPTGGTPRGTVILLPGRGETPAAYQRFGRRISADAWKVRLVPVDLDDLDQARTDVEKLLADESLPSPKVLVGSDSGATFAAHLAASVDADAVVLAGLAFGAPGNGSTADADQAWDDELDARTACPIHRGVLTGDAGFARGSLTAPIPWTPDDIAPSGRPTLVIHGDADTITDQATAVRGFLGAPATQVRLVVGGRHDVLNDAPHRAVAATVVLFLESVRLGADLPELVREVSR